jgi:hypothetical protein
MVQEPKDSKSNLSGGKKDFADRRDCRSNITEPKEKAAKWWCSAPCVLSLEGSHEKEWACRRSKPVHGSECCSQSRDLDVVVR